MRFPILAISLLAFCLAVPALAETASTPDDDAAAVEASTASQGAPDAEAEAEAAAAEDLSSKDYTPSTVPVEAGPSQAEVEDAVPEGAALTGKELYERFLQNKIHSAVQYQKIISRDPGGNEQVTRFWVRWKDYTNGQKETPEDGIANRTFVKFSDPFDMRHTGYLMVVHTDRASDQWVYRPSERKVRRVKLNGTSVMGSDYTYDDIQFQNIENADYVRLPDEEIDGRDCYVVQATLKPFVQSRVSRTVTYMEKEHYVPLLTRYWDNSEVEVRKAVAKADSITEFNGVWVATHSTMHNLQEETSSTLIIEKLDPNPKLADNLFSIFRLSLRR